MHPRFALPGLFPRTFHQLARALHLLSFHAQINPRDVRPEEECDGPVEDDAQSPAPARHLKEVKSDQRERRVC